MSKLSSLEGVRAVAALLVVAYHVQTIFGRFGAAAPFAGAFAGGHYGVDLFFVLSGFIITYVHGRDCGDPSRVRSYLVSRLARVYPAVWILSACALAVYAVGAGGAEKAIKLEPHRLAESLLLLPGYGDALLNVTWTLKYEMFFYALFALAVVDRRLGIAAIATWQIAVFALVAAGIDYRSVAFGFYLRPMCLEFGLGILTALVLARLQGPLGAVAVRATYATLALAVGAIGTGMALAIRLPAGPGALAEIALFGLGASGLIYALVRLERAGRIRVPAVLADLGGASYGIYLIHFSVATFVATALHRMRTPLGGVAFLCTALAAVGAGLLFTALVDAPLQAQIRRVRRGRPRLAPVPASRIRSVERSSRVAESRSA